MNEEIKEKRSRAWLFVLLPLVGFALFFMLCITNLGDEIGKLVGGTGEVEVVGVARELGSTAATYADNQVLAKSQGALKREINGETMTFLACELGARTESSEPFYRLDVTREGTDDVESFYVFADGRCHMDGSGNSYKLWNNGLYEECAKMFGDM